MNHVTKIDFATMTVLSFWFVPVRNPSTPPLHTIILIHPNNFQANTLTRTFTHSLTTLSSFFSLLPLPPTFISLVNSLAQT